MSVLVYSGDVRGKEGEKQEEKAAVFDSYLWSVLSFLALGR